jgi:hypothetical protein
MGAKCDLCPLKNHGPPVFGDGPLDATIAIVAESPGKEEAAFGVPFVGRIGEYVAAMLHSKGLNRQDVLLENTVACFAPGGDLKSFTAAAKKEHSAKQKAAGVKKADQKAFLTPVDCCMPRLMRSLGVPQCAKCGYWDLHSGHPKKCACVKPSWTKVKDRSPVTVVLALGNAPTLALEGYGGVQAKQMYVFGRKNR